MHFLPRPGLHARRRPKRIRRWVTAGGVAAALGVSPLALPLVASPQAGASTSAQAGVAQGWGPVVAGDEFNGNSVDQAKWGLYGGSGPNGCGPGNGGNGLRCPGQITEGGGVLTITGLPNGTTGGMAWNTDRRYGRWEVRMRVQQLGTGGHPYHPVLLLWPSTDQNWPNNGEIDYAETDADTTQMNAYIHYGDGSPDGTQDAFSFPNINLGQWHTYAVDWEPGRITGYIDGRTWFTDTNPKAQPPGSMHQAIQLDANDPSGLDKTIMQVDWFRMYAPAGASVASAPPPPNHPAVTRLSGADRIGTAVAVSRASFPASHSAGSVVLARDNMFPDALVGGPLAAAKHGPLLLTDPMGLSAATRSELSRVLAPGGTVYVLGGVQAVSPAVVAAIGSMGYHTVRVAGPNRYATAVQVARVLGDPATVFEVTGTNFADALSAAPAAVATQGAILLTQGSSQAPDTAAYLSQHSPNVLYTVGGPACRADSSGNCVMGRDRYATAAAVAQRFFPKSTTVGLATGLLFPDALTAGPLLGDEHAPMILVNPRVPLPTAASSYLRGHSTTVHKAQVFGGDLAVTPAVVNALP